MKFSKNMESEQLSGPIKMFGPLNFQADVDYSDYDEETQCLLCQDKFNLAVAFKIFLQHLFEVHHIVIEEVQHIENLQAYVDYWREKFSKNDIERIIPSVAVDSTDNKFFLLSTLIKEDKELRHRIKLEFILKIQEFERTDTNYKKTCLFCRLNFEGLRSKYIEHLSSQHNLQLGNPQNLVYVDELIEIIEKKLTNLECLYCEKSFPDRNILKEHMRKKIHKRINPHNKLFDKYYIVNYLEPGKTWESLEKERDIYPITCDDNSDEEYSDWNEKCDLITCLLCNHKEVVIDTLLNHMKETHHLDFNDSIRNLDFYQRVKLVNYIRRQVLHFRCIYCDEICKDNSELLLHIKEKNHYNIPSLEIFNQPEYYFPTYENDSFLYLLEDVED